jgi:predicted aspartyl protease
MITPTRLKQQQAQMLQPTFPLALASERDSSLIQYRGQALLDTGFNGFLVINQHIASILKPKLKGTKRVNVGSDQDIYPAIFDTQVVFETLDKDYFVEVEGVLLPNEQMPVIGSKLIDYLCQQQNWHLLLNYIDRQVEFIDAYKK